MIHPIFTGKDPELWRQVYKALAEVLGYELCGHLKPPILQINSGIAEPPDDVKAGYGSAWSFGDVVAEAFMCYYRCWKCDPAYAYLDVEPQRFAEDAGGGQERVTRKIVKTRGEYLRCEELWEPALITMTGRKMCIVRDVRDSHKATTKLGVWSLAKHTGGGYTTHGQFANAEHVWGVTGTEWYSINANPRRAGADHKSIAWTLKHEWDWKAANLPQIPCTQLDLGDEGSGGDLPESEVEEMLTELIKAFGQIAIWFQTDDEATTNYAAGLIRKYADSIRRAIRNIA